MLFLPNKTNNNKYKIHSLPICHHKNNIKLIKSSPPFWPLRSQQLPFPSIKTNKKTKPPTTLSHLILLSLLISKCIFNICFVQQNQNQNVLCFCISELHLNYNFKNCSSSKLRYILLFIADAAAIARYISHPYLLYHFGWSVILFCSFLLNLKINNSELRNNNPNNIFPFRFLN